MDESWEAPWWGMGRTVLRGWKARLAATVGLLVGGLVGIVMYLALLAGRFAWYENLAVVFSVLIVVPTTVVMMWVFWGIAVARRARAWAARASEF
jgi:heme/copper-type cytochrome/quinol oxidase subunit 4